MLGRGRVDMLCACWWTSCTRVAKYLIPVWSRGGGGGVGQVVLRQVDGIFGGGGGGERGVLVCGGSGRGECASVSASMLPRVRSPYVAVRPALYAKYEKNAKYAKLQNMQSCKVSDL